MSLAGAARIGARSSGSDLEQLDATAIEQIGEEVIAVLSRITPDEIRAVVRGTLLHSRHPSWFEGEPDLKSWRQSFFDEFMLFAKYGTKPEGPRLQLIQGGAQ